MKKLTHNSKVRIYNNTLIQQKRSQYFANFLNYSPLHLWLGVLSKSQELYYFTGKYFAAHLQQETAFFKILYSVTQSCPTQWTGATSSSNHKFHRQKFYPEAAIATTPGDGTPLSNGDMANSSRIFSGMESTPPPLARRFLPTAPPGKP